MNMSFLCVVVWHGLFKAQSSLELGFWHLNTEFG